MTATTGTDHASLYDWAFENYEYVKAVDSGTLFRVSAVNGGGQYAPVRAVAATASSCSTAGAEYEVRLELPPFVVCPVREGEIAGRADRHQRWRDGVRGAAGVRRGHAGRQTAAAVSPGKDRGLLLKSWQPALSDGGLDMKVRLQKLISGAGIASRRAAEEMILTGRVCVNGETATLGMAADPELDTVTVDGAPVSAPAERMYIMLNKPRGYVTTLSDERGRKTVAELVSDAGRRLYPVGRLDLNSEGLLIMTDDGEAANALMHPAHDVEKTYNVTVLGSGLTPQTDIGDGVAESRERQAHTPSARIKLLRLRGDVQQAALRHSRGA